MPNARRVGAGASRSFEEGQCDRLQAANLNSLAREASRGWERLKSADKVGDSASTASPSVVPATPSWPIRLFLVALLIPCIIPLGSINMPTYRLVLLATILPCTIAWLRGTAGPVRAADIFLLCYSLWAALSLAMAQGPLPAVQPGGVIIVETLGAYLLGRCYVRDAESFRRMVLFVAKLVIFLLPFSIVEWLSGSKPLLWAFGKVFPTVEITMMTPRMGLWRVQGPFDHSIAYGAFCGSIFALVALVGGDRMSRIKQFSLTGLVGFATMLSMSSAPIAGVVLQAMLIGWNTLLKSYTFRWKILGMLASVAYLVVALGSNQSPVQFYISNFTFNHQTGWYRIWIWDYGSASVLNHPIFGIGLADWARPSWMASDSVDNFWLLTAMRYGLPAFVFLALAFISLMLAIGRSRNGRNSPFANYRAGFLISMLAIIAVGTTVHYWGAPYAWIFFLLGSSAWLVDAKQALQLPGPSVKSARKIEEQPGFRRRLSISPLQRGAGVGRSTDTQS